MRDLSPRYDPQKVEDKWYSYWLKKGYFQAEAESKKPVYTIVIPPPNITGELHYGHALNNTLQDILIRWKRMQGYNSLWLPGTDHSGIAAQWVVEKELASQGLTRQDLGREKFLEKMWEWKERYGNRIISQLKKLGSSCDWSRERFTMDGGLSRAVKEVFIRLYREGLIYQDDYIINWCPRCQTALSDLEVEHKEIKGHLYYIKYPLKQSTDFVVVATTRPETMLGDTAVAVHPEDKRYLHLKGKIVILPLLEREIPLISEELVDPNFGTGAVKITPAHDPNDFKIGRRANLPRINVMNEDATMNEEAGKYKGMERFLCRKEVLKDLEKEGYLEKVEEHLHSVGHCYRCKTMVEPRISRQWFIKMKELAKTAVKAVEEGRVKFIPQSWSKTYFEWMKNVKDWCISRQIWWGHQMPLWYCQECKEVYARIDKPEECKKCKSRKFRQETDVLDTWFSSALWPFSTLGWPEETQDLATFYPTSCLITAPEIIFFWVARMIMMGLKFKGEVPFREVYIHATVRDEEGKKMSKSLGNVLDPLQVIDEYGTDALRFTLAALTTQGRDIYLSEERIEGYRNFANKIWNASRFTLINLESFDSSGLNTKLRALNLTLADRWILTRLNQIIEEVSRSLTEYEFGGAARSLYQFIWHEFCDWYVELAKLRLYQPSDTSHQPTDISHQPSEAKKTAQYVLAYVLEKTLRLLHPFMPFITEEIWQHLTRARESIMISPWPESDGYKDEKAVRDMELIVEVTSAIRNIRGEMNISPQEKGEILLKVKNLQEGKTLKENADYITSLGSGTKLTISSQIKRPQLAGTAVVKEIEIYLPLKDLINLEQEQKRLSKEIAEVERNLERTNKKLKSKDFLTKAPPEVVEKEKRKQEELKAIRKKLKDNVRYLSSSNRSRPLKKNLFKN